MSDAAVQTNVKDLTYLVNCGEKIDERTSIVGQAPIHKAVLSYNTESEKEKMLDSIFRSNADVNSIDSNGWTALHHAAYLGDYKSSKQLLEMNANINAFSNQFKTPLHFAALNNHPMVCQLLITNGADIEAMDEKKCTPLHLACKKGSQDCLELLLSNGANIMAQDFR